VIRRRTPPIPHASLLARRGAALTVVAGLAVLGCTEASAVAATADNPIGHLDQAVASGSTAIRVIGWAADPSDLRQPLTVRGSVDGVVVGQQVTAVARPDVVAARLTGPTPGFAMALPALPGSHTVCVTAVNLGAGTNTTLRCWNVVVPVPAGAIPTAAQLAAESPFGWFDSATASGNTVTLTGWAADPDSLAQPLRITATRDGVTAVITSATVVPRPDVVYARHTGPKPGFSLTTTLANGAHRVCTTAINLAVGVNKLLGCRSVWVGPPPPTAAEIAAQSPVGALESARAAGSSSIQLTGWASDPNSLATSLKVVAYLDGSAAATVTAAVPRPDLVTSKHTGPAAGYSFTIPAGTGTHNVCMWAVNIGVGVNKYLGCAALSTPAVAMLPGPAPATPASNAAIVKLARTFVGKPYVWGGASPSGFDCSGLVQYSYRTAAALTTPRIAQDQFNAARMIPAVRAVSGDLVFYHDSTGYVYHVGIYTGSGMTVAAVDPAEGVRAQSIWDSTATFGSFTHS
jgi:cell wall-associated NlpC family hydrolase